MGFPSVECTKDTFLGWRLSKAKEVIGIEKEIERNYKEVLEPYTKNPINLDPPVLNYKAVVKILCLGNNGKEINQKVRLPELTY